MGRSRRGIRAAASASTALRREAHRTLRRARRPAGGSAEGLCRARVCTGCRLLRPQRASRHSTPKGGHGSTGRACRTRGARTRRPPATATPSPPTATARPTCCHRTCCRRRGRQLRGRRRHSGARPTTMAGRQPRRLWPHGRRRHARSCRCRRRCHRRTVRECSALPGSPASCRLHKRAACCHRHLPPPAPPRAPPRAPPPAPPPAQAVSARPGATFGIARTPHRIAARATPPTRTCPARLPPWRRARHRCWAAQRRLRGRLRPQPTTRSALLRSPVPAARCGHCRPESWRVTCSRRARWWHCGRRCQGRRNRTRYRPRWWRAGTC
mmetsp:Transcript_70197/g.192657  ORF Transcript_70197/g.192657 Transcript_70197/m.192657 type:complete len:326 (+) Transcript_70197:836-1813(+)